MRSETDVVVSEIQSSLDLIRQRKALDTASHRLEEFNAMCEDPDLWSNPVRAQGLMRERQTLIDSITEFRQLEAELAETLEFGALGKEEGDLDVVAEAEAELVKLRRRAKAKEVEALLDGEADGNDSFLEVNAGAGGTEACDWTQMLSRMYERWSQRRGYEFELISKQPGDEAGLRSAAYRIRGTNAYGWLKSESGVHRLVRISPYNANSKRHTTFSSVWVYPVVDENIDVSVDPGDIRVDTFRSSGAGGQHVNKTDSAVRMTHVPTGIVVTSSEKSQHQNRALCMAALKSKLYQLELDRRKQGIREAHLAKGEAGWGNQIRSYVLHPYQMVKDLRSNWETSDVKRVLDGDLDEFMSSVLALSPAGGSRSD
ncbi:MAG: peptide chain release factor 2 [Paracoccaceae bacterium]|nr:peptide chain release factor 2 [Paracoccaceae bacterium]MDE2915238.1 peptide chain release factor 2 [Paracoccaceae bacterium]